MNIWVWIILVFTGMLSFMPLVRIKIFEVNKDYSTFKYTSLFLFLWTLIIVFILIYKNGYLIYYLYLLTFPIIFITIATFMIALAKINGFKNISLYKWISSILFLFILLMVSTNDLHKEFLNISASTMTTYQEMDIATKGWIFYVYAVISYLALIFSIFLLFKILIQKFVQNNDILPIIMISIGSLIGVVLNIIHIFFYSFVIDPTYISAVIILSLIYFWLLIRDIKLLIFVNNYDFIFDNLREMYVIVDQNNCVVDASNELYNKFQISLNKSVHIDDLIAKMSLDAVIYENNNEMHNQFKKDKLYLHMQKKEIKIPWFKYSGKLYMFFDQTNTQKYINDLDYILSHDLMTNIYNRNYYEENKNIIHENSENYGLIVFDLDGLKLRNDYLGHEAGDKFLFNFAKILIEIQQEYEKVYPIRMGGDEFLLIVENTNKEIIEEIVKKIKEKSDNMNKLMNIVFSCGYEINDSKYLPIDKALARADAKMYENKKKNLDFKVEFEKYLKSITK